MLTIDPHPLLDLRFFVGRFPRRLGEMPTMPALLDLLRPDATAPLQSDDTVRDKVRALLRHGGFKPTGRSKPASEYLLKASQEGSLSSINLAVDLCNIVSLHSGLPISVVDAGLLQGGERDLRVGLAPAGATYVFNASGQSIDLGGLLCLFDAGGPCANGVKDAQRTKTSADTQRVLVLIWGTNALPDRSARAEAWYRELLVQNGAEVSSDF
jgi:DNA/RNA-binding domain of Phe-tRNA-synthetase-like protein